MEQPKLKEIEREYLNKETIARKKAEYGNNLPKIASKLNRYMRTVLRVQADIQPRDASYILATTLKEARIEDCWRALQKCPYGTEEYMAKLFSYEESCRDYANYMWIATHYEEYLELGGTSEPD